VSEQGVAGHPQNRYFCPHFNFCRNLLFHEMQMLNYFWPIVVLIFLLIGGLSVWIGVPTGFFRWNTFKSRICFVVLAELVFVYVPLVVLAIFYAYQTWPSNEPDLSRLPSDAKGHDFFFFVSGVIALREISFANTILFGLSAIKCVVVAGRAGHAGWQKPVGAAAGLIGFGLVASFVVLLLILESEVKHSPPLWLNLSQCLLFMVGSIAFFFSAFRAEALEMATTLIEFSIICETLEHCKIPRKARKEFGDIWDALQTSPSDKKKLWIDRAEKWVAQHTVALGSEAEAIGKSIATHRVEI
jgi:hypothetical protein